MHAFCTTLKTCYLPHLAISISWHLHSASVVVREVHKGTLAPGRITPSSGPTRAPRSPLVSDPASSARAKVTIPKLWKQLTVNEFAPIVHKNIILLSYIYAGSY